MLCLKRQSSTLRRDNWMLFRRFRSNSGTARANCVRELEGRSGKKPPA